MDVRGGGRPGCIVLLVVVRTERLEDEQLRFEASRDDELRRDEVRHFEGS
jgi:hypothetical protein